jgi:hypothetical protein
MGKLAEIAAIWVHQPDFIESGALGKKSQA